jgi:hypothetical protein
MKTILDALYNFLNQHPPALDIYKMLECAGDLYLIGGALREYKDRGDIKELRDIDVIIDISSKNVWEELLQNYVPAKNCFGGYKVLCGNLIFDVWILSETWAYREKIISCNPEEYIKHLPETVFLNLDAIVCDVKRNIWYDQKYREAMQNMIIDVVLEENPQILLNIVRAFILKKRYTMSFSDKLMSIIKDTRALNKDFIGSLMQIQKKRYKEIIIEQREIEDILV